ncbi:MAG: hypothetical protein ABIV43_01595 [Candidatus Saccharimonadales bacterium]
MFKEIEASVIRWNASTNERQKLQHSYLALTIALILIAGVVSLLSANFGHNLTYLAGAAVVAFAINALVWNLLNSALLTKLPVRPKRTK